MTNKAQDANMYLSYDKYDNNINEYLLEKYWSI